MIIEALENLPKTPTASHAEMLAFIDQARLAGLGIGLIDCHLLAATRLSQGCRLWTRDKRLNGAAERLGIAYGGDNGA